MSDKKITFNGTMTGNVNMQEFKNWIKSCPFSLTGVQILAWETLSDHTEPP